MRRHCLALLLSLAAVAAAASAEAAGPYRYAWIPVDAFDRNGNPVKDEKGEVIHDGFCVLWKTNWLTENDAAVSDDVLWWTGVTYVVDPRRHTVTVLRVKGPNAVATDKGPKFFGREPIEYGVRVTVPLLDEPRDDWPCTKDTWATILAGAKEWTTQTIMPRSTYTYTRSCSPHCN